MEAKELQQHVWDSVIIGGGPAGYNAALYMIRKGFRPLLVMAERGGQLPQTNEIENYLGFEKVTGFELTEIFHQHVNHFDVDIQEYDYVTKLSKPDDLFEVELSSGSTVKAKTIIYATGGAHRLLGVEGESLLNGRGVSYCAICDAPFFKKREVVVVGGGDSAVEAAIDLAKWATHVHLVHRSTFRAEKIMLDRMKSLDNVTYELGSVVQEIKGETSVEAVMIYNKEKDLLTERKVDGVFIEIGQDPRIDLVKDWVELNENNEIIVNRNQETNVAGLYASGDVTNLSFKQIIIAASEGAIAGLSASQYITKMDSNQ